MGDDGPTTGVVKIGEGARAFICGPDGGRESVGIRRQCQSAASWAGRRHDLLGLADYTVVTT